jgi:hypothetical protein
MDKPVQVTIILNIRFDQYLQEHVRFVIINHAVIWLWEWLLRKWGVASDWSLIQNHYFSFTLLKSG